MTDDPAVLIDFQPDNHVIGRDRVRFAVAGAGASALALTYFRLPMRIQVDGIDLFQMSIGVSDSPWRELPLVGTAFALPVAIQQAWLNGSSDCPLGDSGFSVQLRRVAEGLEASLPFAGTVGRAPYPAFIEAIQQFSAKAREYLLGRFPELADDALVGIWINGDDPWGLEEVRRGGRRADD